LGRGDASVLSIARTSLPDVAGLISRDAGIAAGFPYRTDLAAGYGGDGGVLNPDPLQQPVSVAPGHENGAA